MQNKKERYFPLTVSAAIILGTLAGAADFFMLLASGKATFAVSLRLALSSAGIISFIALISALIARPVIAVINRIVPNLVQHSLVTVLSIATAAFCSMAPLLLNLSDNRVAALIALEIIGGATALVTGLIVHLLQKKNLLKSRFFNGRATIIAGLLVIAILLACSFIKSNHAYAVSDAGYSPAEDSRPNVIILLLDTVRADHLSVYGYGRRTTPFLEQLADDFVVFDNAFSTSFWTIPGHASLFTGLYPSQHKAHGEHFWLYDSYRTLAEILTDNGYRTAGFSTNGFVSSETNMVQGFQADWYRGGWTDEPVMPRRSFGDSLQKLYRWLSNFIRTRVLFSIFKVREMMWDYPGADVINDAFIDWLDNTKQDKRPFFAFINYMEAHSPYNPDEESAKQFLSEAEIDTSYRRNLRNLPIEKIIDIAASDLTADEIKIVEKLYDASLLMLDKRLKTLFDMLDQRQIGDNTLLIITADHGEYLGTKNKIGHSMGLHDELIHIPLMIRFPEKPPQGGRRIDVVNLIDVFETVLATVGVEERPDEMPEAFNLREPVGSEQRVVLCEAKFNLGFFVSANLAEDQSRWFVEQKAVRSIDRHLIWKSRGESEFYDTLIDPGETSDIYLSEREQAQRFENLLFDLNRGLKIPETETESKYGTVPGSNERVNNLRDLGYVK